MGKWLSKSWATHVIKYHKAITDNAKAVVIVRKKFLLHVKERSITSFTYFLELNICNVPGIVLSSFIEYYSFNDELTKWLNDIILNTCFFFPSSFFKSMCQSVGGWFDLFCGMFSCCIKRPLVNIFFCQLMLPHIIFDSCLVFHHMAVPTVIQPLAYFCGLLWTNFCSLFQ